MSKGFREMTVNRENRRFDSIEPRNAEERSRLCGFDARASEQYWDKNAGEHQAFFLAGQTATPPDTVRLWELQQQVAGENPDLSPQPTGNCVVAALAEAIELLQCSEISLGDEEEFRKIFNPFLYATTRVKVMKNSLRGSAGASPGAAAEAVRKFGVLQIQDGLPKYNKTNVDNWGNGKKADGIAFDDFLEQAAVHVIRATSRITSMGHMFEAMGSRYPLTIASNRGYAMKPDREGFHRPSGTWNHQMGIHGYSISGNWVAVKNQWGDVHGDIVDSETEEQWPPGYLRVHLDEFERVHFKGSETIVYSAFDGYPERKFDHRELT